MENESLLRPLADGERQAFKNRMAMRHKVTDPYPLIKDIGMFEKWWKMYAYHCKRSGSNAGDRKGAAIAWVSIQDSVDTALILEGTEWDIERTETSPSGSRRFFPYGSRYLTGVPRTHPTPYWQVALEDKADEYGKEIEPRPVKVISLRPFKNTPDILTEEEFKANQGIDAPHSWNGLNFRSLTEVRIAEALEAKGVLFFANAKARLGDKVRRVNREPDFLICDSGRWGILEVDGEHFHHSAAKDHDRDRLFQSHGVDFIQHYDAALCYQNPQQVVKEFLLMMKKFCSRQKG